MKTLVISDLHLSANPRDAYRHAIVHSLCKYAKEGIRRTLILGDLTEEKDRHNDWLVNNVVARVVDFAKLGEVFILKGNHDYNSDPDMPYFRFLGLTPNVHWISNPTVYTFTADDLGSVLFLPHTRRYKREWKDVRLKGHRYIFAHNTFKGAQLAGGYKSDGIPLSIFPKDACVISGDVHIPQELGCVTYVGAPYTIDFGDNYDGRCLIINGEKVTSVKINGPQKQLVEVDTHDELHKAGAQFRDGDIIKIRATIPRSEATNWPKVRDELRAWAQEQGAIIHAIQPVIIEDAVTRKRIKKAEIKSDQQIIREFAKTRGIDKHMLKYGEKLL